MAVRFFEGINEWQWWVHYLVLPAAFTLYIWLLINYQQQILKSIPTLFIVTAITVFVVDRIIHVALKWD